MNSEQIEQYIIDSITADAGITDVISLRPGLGKSQFIIKRMSEALKSYRNGLIVVTDSVDRLTHMINGESVNDDIADFMKRNRNNISLLTADTFKDEIKTTANNHIIAMTTQRFFRMKPSEINSIINNSRYNIEQILIDEQPLIIEVQSIGIKQLAQIDEAINTALTNLTDQDDKRQIKESFNLINASLRKAFEEAENKNDSGYFNEYYYNAELQSVSDTLCILTDKYKTELNSYNYDVVQYLQVLAHIADDGGMIVSQKRKSQDDTNKYTNYISVVIDYRNYYTEINTKIVVFDGTADINPLYKTDYFNIIDCKEIEANIPKLSINIIDISASKTKLIKEPLHLKAIVDYLQAEPQQTQAIFTFKDIESQFEEVTEKTAHFNNIKGFNEFRELTNITQIGLNRYPDHVYKFLCGYSYANKIQPQQEIVLSGNAIAWYKSQGLTVPQRTTAKSTTRIISNKHLINYRNRLILSDIVQNVFRSKIRQQDNREPITYNLIFSYSANNDESQSNSALVKLIQNYFKPLGVSVNLISTPRQIREYKVGKRNNKSDSIAQRILEWLQRKPKGYIFAPKEIQKDLDITSPQYNTSIDHNKELKAILQSMKIKRGLYQI